MDIGRWSSSPHCDYGRNFCEQNRAFSSGSHTLGDLFLKDIQLNVCKRRLGGVTDHPDFHASTPTTIFIGSASSASASAPSPFLLNVREIARF
jgi:hypothetical protein